jgi:radical SAM family uncharacterized protein/radical SAM-linked protein
MNFSIKDKLAQILPLVQNPGRYIGGEGNRVLKDHRTLQGTIALAFPDTYEVGMSNNSTKVLYHIVNREADLAAEVCFAPWTDMSELMRTHNIPLYTHESYFPVASFDVIGMSLQTELNFTNVPYLLELAGLKAFAAERAPHDPIIIGGGPVMANPEPVADFFDAFLIGDGEHTVPKLVRQVGIWRKEGQTRDYILRELATWDGLYIPRHVAMTQNPWGEWIPTQAATGSYERTKGIRRVWVPTLEAAMVPTKNLIPNTSVVHERFSVEVMRGCTQGCRFCQAGYWYRPNRELNPDDALDLAKEGLRHTGERELGLLSLSTADYGPVEPLVDALIQDEELTRINVSLPSLRANSFGQSLAGKVAAIKGGRSATFAPETGSERLRKMINKTISDQEMYDAAENVFREGFNKIKLYTMIGLPTENMEDMEAFCGLIEGLVKIGRKYSRKITVHASIGIMVPKPFTPMQWVEFAPKESVLAHLRFVRERFYRDPNVKITWSDYDLAYLEAFYSRGDRSLAPMIYEAYQRGIVFESYGERCKHDVWEEIRTQFKYPVERILQPRALEEVFPWDFIHAGLTKGYLKNEYKKMYKSDSEPVPDCKWGECQHCGVPGNYEDIQLAPMPERHLAPARSINEVRELMQERKSKDLASYKYHLVYTKRAMSRYLPHQNTMSMFERTVARIGNELSYSKGFNPKPIIRSQGALPLGLESHCEVLVLELLRPISGTPAEQLRELNKGLPEGLEVISIRLSESSRMEFPQAVEYLLENIEGAAQAVELFKNQSLPEVTNHRGKTFCLNDEVLDVKIVGNALHVYLHTNETGNTISPYLAFAAMVGISEAQMREKNIVKVQNLYSLSKNP